MNSALVEYQHHAISVSPSLASIWPANCYRYRLAKKVLLTVIYTSFIISILLSKPWDLNSIYKLSSDNNVTIMTKNEEEK